MLLFAGGQFPIWLVFIFLAAARFFYLESKGAREAAIRAEKGGEAEDRVGNLLKELKDLGWQIEKNVLLPREGDVDFLVTAPNLKVFAIDVKSHGGVITEREGTLLRNDQPLERDLLAVIRRQAAIVSSQRNCGQVIPILAFTRARLELPHVVDGVHIIKAHRLVETLSKVAE